MDPDLVGDWRGVRETIAFDAAGWRYTLFDYDYDIDQSGGTLTLTPSGGAPVAYWRNYGHGAVLWGAWRYGPDALGDSVDLFFVTPNAYARHSFLNAEYVGSETGHFDASGGSGGGLILRERVGKAQLDGMGGIEIQMLYPGDPDQVGTYAFNADKSQLTLTLDGTVHVYQRV